MVDSFTNKSVDPTGWKLSFAEVQDLQKELHEAQEISSRLATQEARPVPIVDITSWWMFQLLILVGDIGW